LRYLQPIQANPKFAELLENSIAGFLNSILVIPLANIIGRTELTNSKDVIEEAFRNGTIYYSGGEIKGRFNSRISRELIALGAVFLAKKGAYRINADQLTPQQRSSILLAKTRQQSLFAKADLYLSTMSTAVVPTAIAYYSALPIFRSMLKNLNTEANKTLKDMSIKPYMNQEIEDRLAAEYSENLKLDIKGWSDDQVLRLREKIYKSTFDGYRYEDMIDIVKSVKHVSDAKARFLAKQENSLLVSKYRESRYADVGITEYKWRIVGHGTRPDHRVLDDHIFRFDNPPVTNQRTGARNNPGEDYGCRCLAIPIVYSNRN